MSDAKARARRQAAEVRARARSGEANDQALAHLEGFLAGHAGRTLAGYVAIRSEIDPGPVLSAWTGPVALPVVAGSGRPLVFRRWWPGAALAPGTFGVLVPPEGPSVVPDILIVPLLAYDRRGMRLGYGGGFYDRTLAALRGTGRRPLAVGFAFSAQRVEDLPVEATDAPLDAIVTEEGAVTFPER